MNAVTQAQSFGDIRVEGQGNRLVINQIVQISVEEIRLRPFVPSSPYVGLSHFDEAHKDVFFGRDALIAKLMGLVANKGLVLATGASGGGKSSVVRSGLLPQLRRSLPQGRFRALIMTPDRDPFTSLRGALHATGLKQSQTEEVRSDATTPLAEELSGLRPPEALWLLFVDQFEEVFTLCRDPAVRARFFEGLVALASTGGEALKVVLAMRADFFDRLGGHPELAELAEAGLCMVNDMHRSELRAAIEQPAARHGVVFEDGLVEQIIADVKGHPGALPLLQYTLDLLWREDSPENDRTLNREPYGRLGGIEGSLRQRADGLFERSSRGRRPTRTHVEKETMRRIFLRLVDLTSQGADARAVSKRALLSEFEQAEEQMLIAELVDEKLLVSNAPLKKEPSHPGDSPTVEIAHEALLSAWPMYEQWIEQALAVLYVRNRLSADARRWVEVKAKDPSRADEELWAGTRLSQAQELRVRGEFVTVLGGLRSDEASFLDASEARKTRLAQEATDQLRRERETAEKNRQQLLDTYIERGRQLLFKEHKPYPAVLWLHRAYKMGSKNSSLSDLLRSAMQHVDATIAVLCQGSLVMSATFSPDGQLIALGCENNSASIWETESGRLIAKLTGHTHKVVSAEFSPEGRWLVTASLDHSARLWEVTSGRLFAELRGHQAALIMASFSSDGRRVLTASTDGTAQFWDPEDARLVAKFLTGRISSVALSLDGLRAFTGSEKRMAAWEPESGRQLWEIKNHGAWVSVASFSSDGRRILTASQDNMVRVLDAESGRLQVELRGHDDLIASATFSPDNLRILTASCDCTVRLWDAESGRQLIELKGQEAGSMSASFSPDGRRILTANYDGAVRVWDIENQLLLTELKGHGAGVKVARYSPNGQRILTAARDLTARVWDASDRRRLAELRCRSVQSAMYSPDGRSILTSSHGDAVARLWDAEEERLLAEFRCPQSSVMSARYSPDGRRVLVASQDSTAHVWDAKEGRLLAEIKGHEGLIESTEFSHDGRRILTASKDFSARVWDAESGHLLAELKGPGFYIRSARFSPDGRFIVTSSYADVARVWDASEGRLLAELRGHEMTIWSAKYSPDGRSILTASEDGVARVWDAGTARLLAELKGHDFGVWSARYSPDGHRIVTVSRTGSARIWEAGGGRLLAEFGNPENQLESARFSPDGLRIVTASNSDVAWVWDAESGQPLAALKGHGGCVRSAEYSPDGRRILVAGGGGLVRVWDVSAETRAPEQIVRLIRARSCVRFEPEDGNVLVPCIPPATSDEGGPLLPP